MKWISTSTAIFTSLATALVAASVLLTVLIRVVRLLKELHDLINSRLTELILSTKKASHAEGMLEGREHGRQEERTTRRHEGMIARGGVDKVESPPAQDQIP